MYHILKTLNFHYMKKSCCTKQFEPSHQLVARPPVLLRAAAQRLDLDLYEEHDFQNARKAATYTSHV